VQFIFAGKAHPADNLGKELVRSIVQFTQRPDVAGHVVFLEDYDMEVARYLVQGVDVWLNNPRPPLEASGTSGMKAVANGALHFSTKDGWWAEVNSEGLGWTIGRGEEYPREQHNYQDEVEARDLYDILEKEIIPLFYERNADGIPRGWADMMKHSMRLLCPYFNSNRMVREYTADYYLRAAGRFAALEADGLAAGREYSQWRRKMERTWGSLRVRDIKVEGTEMLAVGDLVTISATIDLGEANAKDLLVELLLGAVEPDHHIGITGGVSMVCTETSGTQGTFTAQVPMDHAGRIGFALRILAMAPGSDSPEILPGLVKIVESGGY
jgi:starch phosphorylase